MCVCVCVIFVTIMYINVLCFYLNVNEYMSNKSGIFKYGVGTE